MVIWIDNPYEAYNNPYGSYGSTIHNLYGSYGSAIYMNHTDCQFVWFIRDPYGIFLFVNIFFRFIFFNLFCSVIFFAIVLAIL